MNIRQKHIPIEILEQIDDQCAEFEKAWQSGDPRSIESVLVDNDSEEEKEVLLAELIALDVDYRRRRGEPISDTDYSARFPDHPKVIADVFKNNSPSNRAFEAPPIATIAEMFPALQVIELLGAGGMGAVYKAKQEGLDRIVALKVLPSELARESRFSLRFAREARTLAKLNHPSIVSVHEFGNVADTFYFLMEYVEGPTLREVVSAGTLAPAEALVIVPHLCDALQYAHDNGVIHRDIKPENILLATDGSVKVVDFGLSRILGGPSQSTNLTRTHQVMGTPRYMAPEQFEATHNVDHRADIYSLGVVFYELLTGELPVGRFAVPSRKVAIDVRLDEVVLRTLQREPKLRYQSASAIKSDLESINESSEAAIAVTLTKDASNIPNQHARSGAATSDHVQALTDSNQSSVVDQELAARMLLGRRDLMKQVENAMRPLFRWQMLQIPVGVLLIGIGAYCWSQNTAVPHRLVSGVTVHIYGVALVAMAIAVMVRIKRIDYSTPLASIQQSVDDASNLYLRLSPLVGFPWWLMWIPAAIALGFDQIMYPRSLVPSLVIGVIGLVVCLGLYYFVQHPSRPNAASWKREFSGPSFRKTKKLLQEIRDAGIE